MNEYDANRNEWNPPASQPAAPGQTLRLTFMLGVVLLFVFCAFVFAAAVLFRYGGSSLIYHAKDLIGSVVHPGVMAERLRDLVGNFPGLWEPVRFTHSYGSMAAFMLIGFLLPLIYGPRSMPLQKVMLICFGFSITLELLHLLLYVGALDVKSMAMDMAGGAVGYLVFYGLQLTVLSKRSGIKEEQRPIQRQ